MKRDIFIFVTALVLIVAIITVNFRIETIQETVIVTVEDKDRIVNDGDSYYLIFGSDSNGNPIVFRNVDSMIYRKWNSSNVQAALKEGHTYKVKLVGIRVPFLSMYQNIIDYEEVS